MEEATPYAFVTKQGHEVQTRIPDVAEDVGFVTEHLNDPHFDLSYSPSSNSVVEELSTKDYIVDYGNWDNEFDNESPYPEVRASVSSVDDPSIPVNTFRMWFLGIFFVLVNSGLNQVFLLRYPSILITGTVSQLVCLPLGRGLAAILPTKYFNTFSYVWSLNPSPFSIKEHVCITVMSSIGASGYYSTRIPITQHVFYGQATPVSFQILLAIGSQCLGFCLGGLLRPFVVWPSAMIWPRALVNCALLNALHKNYGKYDQGQMTRERFFCIAMAVTFVWYWVPGYLFTGLGIFNWVCWIAPNNVVLNSLFGTYTGLGMSVLTFDWAMISTIANPLTTPWWCQMNTGVAFLLMFWVIGPILYFKNVWNMGYLPISSHNSFDNTGSPYIVRNIVTNGVFDPVKYTEYSPVFLPTTLVLTYAAAFAAFPALFIHIFLWYRKDIVHRFHNTLKDECDVHSRLMQYYPEVPTWWYGIIGIISFTLLCGAIKIIPTQFPIWAAVVGVLLSFALAIPLSMLVAITNQCLPMQVMYELIGGYMLPGRPFANTIFKVITTATGAQTTTFSGDLKLGHYMKIPPRIMFSIQIVSAIITCIWVTFVQEWMLNNIEDICTPHQKQGFTCPGSTTFATASIIWGAIGPRRLFNPGAPYSTLLWFFPIGIFTPIPFYLLARRFSLSFWRYINVPASFATLMAVPEVSGLNYSSWVLCGFIFNYVIRRFRFRWWLRYNYILSAALDAGTATSMITIFFTLTIPKTGGIQPNWWGNSVSMNTADANGTPFKPLPLSGVIGPVMWS